MAIIQVSVSLELVKELMTTGYEVHRATCTKGLPGDAHLVDVIFHPEASRVDLLFESDSTPDGGYGVSGGIIVPEYTEALT